MVPSFLAALCWIPSLVGLGALVPHRGDPALRPGIAGLLGLGVAGTVASWLNFRIPVGPTVSASIWVAGLVVLVARRAWIAESLDLRGAVALVLVVAAASSTLRDPLFHFDTGYYHLQAVRWITDAAIVPGIANVHFRLGFNSIWWPTAAALEGPFTAGKTAYFLNLLPIAFAGQLAGVALGRLAAGDRSFSNLALAGAVLPIASATFGIGGLYLDYTTSLVAYVALALWAREWERRDEPGREAAPALLLSVLAALLKITAAVLPAVTLAALALRRPPLPRSWWLRASAIASVAVVPYLARGVLLSGCLAFPVRATCVDGAPWAVPAARTEAVAAAVKAWARMSAPGDGSWGWLRIWPGRELANYPEAYLLLAALGVGLALAIASRQPWSGAAVGVLLVSALGALVWFLEAPDLRFGLGFVFLLGLTPAFASLAADEALLGRRGVRLGTAAALLVASVGLVRALAGHPRDGTTFDLAAWEPPILEWPLTPRAPVQSRTTRSGVRLNVADGECCGAEPVPCTPEAEFDPALRFDGYFSVPR